MKVLLGINTGFALNRYSTPEQWIPLVAEVAELRIVQLTADLLNPVLPAPIIKDNLTRIERLSAHYGIEIRHTFTGAFTRVNHFSHPDASVRDYWLGWFKRFVDISAHLGAESVGSHFGILTIPDLQDPKLRQQRLDQNILYWHKVAEYAGKRGIKYLTWEPMSVQREYGETIPEARRIQQIVNKGSPLPIKLCLDVDHGDLSSSDPKDTDPYEWIRELGSESPIIQIKQSSGNKGGHWPFTVEYNEAGIITPQLLLDALREAKLEEVTLLLELSWREREPFDRRVASDIAASVRYWKPYTALS